MFIMNVISTCTKRRIATL